MSISFWTGQLVNPKKLLHVLIGSTVFALMTSNIFRLSIEVKSDFNWLLMFKKIFRNAHISHRDYTKLRYATSNSTHFEDEHSTDIRLPNLHTGVKLKCSPKQKEDLVNIGL